MKLTGHDDKTGEKLKVYTEIWWEFILGNEQLGRIRRWEGEFGVREMVYGYCRSGAAFFHGPFYWL